MTLAVTRTDYELLAVPAQPPIRVSEVANVVLGGPSIPDRRVTRVVLNLLAKQPAPLRKVTGLNCTILATRTPLYRFNSVILPDVFPYDISFNSVGSTRFATDVIMVDSGDDQRTQRWDQPLMEFDVAYGVRTMEQLHALISFFRAMRGRLYAFNYRDPVDHSSTLAVAIEARAPPLPTPFDQLIGAGDGVTFTFPLSKTYTTPSGLSNQKRLITRPDLTTVRVALKGSEISNWSASGDTGVVTLISPVVATIGHALSKTVRDVGGNAVISGIAGDFTPFASYAGTQRGVVLSGFQNSVNNVPQTVLTTINSVGPDGGTISLRFIGSYGTASESGTINATIAVNPAPAAGDPVTAGFKFFVPCRFDTDTLPVQLEDYGIGSSNSIKLIEVRQSAF